MALALATIQRQRSTLHASHSTLPRFTLYASLFHSTPLAFWRGVGGEASLSLLTICKDKSFHC